MDAEISSRFNLGAYFFGSVLHAEAEILQIRAQFDARCANYSFCVPNTAVYCFVGACVRIFDSVFARCIMGRVHHRRDDIDVFDQVGEFLADPHVGVVRTNQAENVD